MSPLTAGSAGEPGSRTRGNVGTGARPSGMTTPATPRDQIAALDTAIYDAVASSPTPTIDRALRQLSRAADRSKIWIAAAAVVAAVGGRAGRRAAVDGLASIAVTSAVLNLAVKPVASRRRPDGGSHAVPAARRVPMPSSTSFPSGHAASAFAFAAGVSRTMPGVGAVLHWLAATVAYSRVHTGVHYPTDVVAGALFGGTLSAATISAVGTVGERSGCASVLNRLPVR